MFEVQSIFRRGLARFEYNFKKFRGFRFWITNSVDQFTRSSDFNVVLNQINNRDKEGKVANTSI